MMMLVLLTQVAYAVAPYSSQGKVITFYVPHNAPNCRSSIEGCIETSRPGLNGQSKPVCLDDVRESKAQYVTLASDSSNYGKYYSLGSITYQSAQDDKKYTVDNVVGYVHDTGGAFRGRPDKIDVCTTICYKCTTDAQAGRYGLGIGYAPSGQGQPDYNNASTFANSGWYNTLRALSGQPSAPQSSPFAFTSPVPTSQIPIPIPQTPISSQISISPPSASSSAETSPGSATLFLFAQPHTVVFGRAVLVSWTSVNMNQSSCQVFLNGQKWADGNEGFKNLKTVSGDVGVLSLMLSCTDATGQSRESEDSVNVQ